MIARVEALLRIQQKEAELRQSEEHANAILRTAIDGFWLVDTQGRLLDVNEAYCQMSGYTREELLRMSIHDLVASKSPDKIAADMEKIKQSGSARFETRHQCKDGRFVQFEASVNCMPTSDGRFFCFLRDITERKAHEAEIERLNRLYLALSQVNQLITRVKTREELLAGVCQMLVQYGHLKMAWIGWLDSQTQALIPVAQHGDIGGYLNEIKISADDSPHGRGPTGTAVREARTVVCNDFMHDASTELWHEAGARQGFGSSSAFPIRYGGLVYGVLTVYAGEPDFFRDKEVRLFEEAAMDVSFALDHLEQEMQKQRAEEELRVNRELLRSIIDSTPSNIFAFDLEHRFTLLNDSMARFYGVSKEQLLGKTLHDVFSKGLADTLMATNSRIMTTGETISCEEVVMSKNANVPTVVMTSKFPLRDSQGKINGLAGVATDITERKQAEEAIRKSEQEFHSLAEAMPQIVWITRPDGWNIYFNQQWMDYTGLTMEESYGHGWNIPFHPEDRQRAWDAWQHATTACSTYELECRLRRADGSYRWWLVRGVPLRDANGEILKWFGTCTDIEDIKRTEGALRESQSKLMAALNSMTDAVFISDSDGNFIEFNEAFASFHRFKSKAECAKRLSEYHEILDVFMDSGELAPLEMWAVPRALRGETATNAEYTLRLKGTGETWYGSYSFSPIRNDKGEIIGSVVVGRDITERKQMEKKLRDANWRWENIIEGTHVGTWEWNIQTGETVFNEVWAQIIGYTLDELAPISIKTWETLAHPDDKKRSAQLLAQHFAGDLPYYDHECRMKHKDDHWVWVHDRGRLMTRTGEGKPLMMFGSHTDITERKRAEERIRQLSSAVEQSPVSIVITDLTGAIEYVNPKFTQLTGYTLEEVQGQNPRVLKGDKISTDEYRRLWECVTHGQEWHGEFHNRKKNGDFYWESAVISPVVDAEGHTTHYLAVKEDITDRKVLEEQFRQAQKLESIGQLAGGVAHDFNNILAAMMMRLGFMQKNTSNDQEALAELTADAKRAASLTRQLLLFSRRSVMEVELLDLNELVANALKMLSRLIGEHITMQFQRRDGLPGVEADAVMLEQVLMNLAVNARDAMPKGGLLTIRIEPVQIDEEQVKGNIKARTGLFVCLSVADTGCGMDEATLKRIFEPFFTTKPVGKGTGLGLATVHGIVTQHKGWVVVESAPGKGTTFKVFLPATTQGRAEPVQTEKMTAIRGHETILLVEDETILRQLVVQGLRQLGYCVLDADNGQAAMKLWQEHSQQIDLLFSDMVMPEGLTGLDLAEKMKAEKPSLKIIISSGYNMEMVGQVSPTAGGIVYFQKPYEFEVFSKLVRDCLDRA